MSGPTMPSTTDYLAAKDALYRVWEEQIHPIEEQVHAVAHHAFETTDSVATVTFEQLGAIHVWMHDTRLWLERITADLDAVEREHMVYLDDLAMAQST